MKNTLLLFGFFCFNFSLGYGQCIADAGPDQAVCIKFWYLVPEFQIGGNPTAVGGISPYSYDWKVYGKSWESSSLFDISDRFDNISSSNPIWREKSSGFELIDFYLAVTDAQGNSCKDTMRVEFSFLNINIMEYNVVAIEEGDSTWLNAYHNDLPTHTVTQIKWNPIYGLSDSIGEIVRASPDSYTIYRPYFTDILGCVHEGAPQFVSVYPLSVLENQKQSNQPFYSSESNALVSKSSIPLSNQIAIYSIEGKLIEVLNPSNTNTWQLGDYKSGIYFAAFSAQNQEVETLKFVVK